ncbi:uncharacterized protein [Amphiura filiformis]|uniref:uncharacterized protein n=1 Tax=Amphiura filiformis TaxID=82378 RepID=UPI003B21340E
MATYMRSVCKTCAVNFRLLSQNQLWHTQQPHFRPAATILQLPQITRPISGGSETKANDADEDIVNPMSYPGELEEGDGFTMYHGELQEGEERPHMLHAVWRVRSLKRKPWWERDTMELLGLGQRGKVVIHKNTAAVNELLTSVRHLVRIKPIILKYGLPNGDYENTLLKQNGEFIVKRKVKGLQVISEEDERLLNEGDTSESEPKRT